MFGLASCFGAIIAGEMTAAVTIVMLLASVLLMGSVIRNPALPTGGAPASIPARRLHHHASPDDVGIRALGVVPRRGLPRSQEHRGCPRDRCFRSLGAALQDRKKERLQPVLWQSWEAKTSYLPFAAVADGRARLGGFGMHALAGALVVWLAATWAHIPLAGWAAGIWRWL